jgi:hypothetical protein
MFAIAFIVLLVIAVFAMEMGKRWWQENAWRRQWRRRDD